MIYGTMQIANGSFKDGLWTVWVSDGKHRAKGVGTFLSDAVSEAVNKVRRRANFDRHLI